MDLPPIEYTNIVFSDKYIKWHSDNLSDLIIRDNELWTYCNIDSILNMMPGCHFLTNYLATISVSPRPQDGPVTLLTMELFGSKVGFKRFNHDGVEIFIREEFRNKIESILHESLRKIINVK